MRLEDKFISLSKQYSSNIFLINSLYKEITNYYTQPNRYYHNLRHLEIIYNSLESIKIPSAVEFAIFYHDIIYDVESGKNEENSALIAKDRLLQLGVPNKITEETVSIILATKNHVSNNENCKLFISADLYIFALPKIEYFTQIRNIKKEYNTFFKTYNSKRIEVLKSFLNRDKIFTHQYFYQYEHQARENIKSEIEYLRINSEF